MTYLVACLSTGKGTWTELSKIIKKGAFEKCYLITNSFGKEKFKEENCELIVVDFNKPIGDLIEDIKKSLSGKIIDTEVGLNIISGTGYEHMAIISALLKLGLGIRLVSINDKDEIIEI